MITKFISLATAIVTLDVYLQSQLHSSDPLFLFASNNLVVNIGLLILVSLMVSVSFKSKFRRWWSFAACATATIVLGMIGLLGIFFSDTVYSFPSVLLPLNYMLMIEAAVVFGISSLSYEHQPLPFKITLPNPAAWLPKLAFPVPKIPHSPNPSRTQRTQPV